LALPRLDFPAHVEAESKKNACGEARMLAAISPNRFADIFDHDLEVLAKLFATVTYILYGWSLSP
jgi:hypothetical protein